MSGSYQEDGFEDNLGEWAHQINRMHEEFGFDAGKLLEYESSMFARDMMSATPPKDAKKTRESIESSIKAKFLALEHPKREWSNSSNKLTSEDVQWYAFTHSGIFGIARDQDKRGASVEELYSMLPSIVRSKKAGFTGKLRVGQRGKQTIYISRKIFTKAETRRALIKKVVEHIGRLASGWYPSWVKTGRRGRPVPHKIERHAGSSQRVGAFVDGLSMPDPEFTLINRANGAEQIDDWLMSKVLNFRAHSIATKIERLYAWRAENPGKTMVLAGDIVAEPSVNMDAFGGGEE